MTVNEIIKAQQICFLSPTREECGHCTKCPLFELNMTENCQKFLAENTIKKLSELVELLDDKVNHHYYDTLEFMQEENTSLRKTIGKIYDLISKEVN